MVSDAALPDGWITTQSLRHELTASGYPASERQLERWRNAGLLPAVKQVGTYDGSVTWCPPTTLPQSIALQRVLAVKDRFSYAGKILWAAGFAVDERYWVPGLEKADRLLRRAAPTARFILGNVDEKFSNTTFGELVAPLSNLTGPLAKMARRLDRQETAFALDTLMEILAGDFQTFGVAASDRDEFEPAATMRTAFDFEKGARDQVFGKRLKLGQALESILAGISAAQVGFKLADFSPSEIAAARDDVRNALKIAVCFYESMSWIYGDKAFGLRFANFIARTLPGNLIYTLTIGIARLRRNQADLYPSLQIAEMGEQAEMAWLISDYFRELLKSRPDLAHIIGPDRFRLAFSSSVENRNMREKLELNQFPQAQFRPWESWRKLMKKTISHGLLIMSIGSPLKSDISEIRSRALEKGHS